MSTQSRQGTIRPHAGSNPMKWTITNIMYAFVACVLMTGLFHELKLQWVGNAFVVLDIILIMVAFLKYLNGDHLS
jgi:uncharacterized membrane protein